MNYYYKWTDVIQSLLTEMKRLWMYFRRIPAMHGQHILYARQFFLEVENVSVELTQNLLKDTTFLPY